MLRWSTLKNSPEWSFPRIDIIQIALESKLDDLIIELKRVGAIGDKGCVGGCRGKAYYKGVQRPTHKGGQNCFQYSKYSEGVKMLMK